MESLSSRGSEFQSLGAQMLKARSPTHLRARGTVSRVPLLPFTQKTKPELKAMTLPTASTFISALQQYNQYTCISASEQYSEKYIHLCFSAVQHINID